jgi:hypothetical protein
MSRGLDDERVDLIDRTPERSVDRRPDARAQDVPMEGLDLPRGEERERFEFRGREYSLNGSEIRALATVGAFRVMSPEDLDDGQRGTDAWHGKWRHLGEQGLLTHETITDRDGAHHVVALTRDGKDLLDAHSTTRSDGHRQEYYADVVKPRELQHDTQLYRVFKEEAALIERDGGRVTRVVLDYELKRDYQQFLNREGRDDDADVMQERLAFAEAHDLSVVRGHLELPDIRIDYETEDGRREHRDVELVTEHYSRGQIAGKARAGFVCYRTGASGKGNRRGGTPFDPRHLERL